MRLVPLAAAAAALLSTRLLLADAPTFSWSRGADAASCPNRAVVLRDLEGALGAPLDARLQGRALEVTVHRDDAIWRATLWWRDPTGALLGTRHLQVTAADCEALLRATRASVVIALNSGVFEGDGEPDRPPAPPSAVMPVAPAVTPVPPAVTPVLPAVTPVLPAEPGRAVSLGGELALGWVPGLAWGASLHVEAVAWRRLRVNARAAALAESPVDAVASASFAAVEFGADVCAVPLRGSVFELDGCIGARAGVVQSFGYARDVPTRGGAGSFAMPLALAARVDAGPLVVALEPALRWNVTRVGLRRDDGSLLAEQPPLAFSLSLRVGWRFR